MTSPRFNVLNREESVHRNLLLEASAGTGKTFAIENIVVRLLIESCLEAAPLLIENILVVTFTKIAVRELKERIHSNLEKSLDLLKRLLGGEKVENHFPDYLAAYAEKGEEAVASAKKMIERALFSFDRAQIFTIHGFCWRMLKSYSMEAGISLDVSSSEDQTLSRSQMLRVVRDFLGSGLSSSNYSPQQLKIIMNKSKRSAERLQQELLNQINRGMEIESPPAFFELVAAFQAKMKNLQQEFAFESSKILEDFLRLAPFYKELCDKNKQVHPEKMEKIQRFATLFDRQEWHADDLDELVEDGIFLLEALHPSLLKAKVKPSAEDLLHYPHFLTRLREQLEPLVAQARNETFIFARLASDCQKFVKRYQEQAEVFGHTDLLVQMGKAVDRPEFAERVRSNYTAAIIDEFQDTDPLQWEIFSSLFASQNNSWKGYLNLVGDPKQSIYAFRQADIYTYLSAADRLGPAALATLDTNFRSQSSLIDALNILFNAIHTPFSLPKSAGSLPYRTVQIGRKDRALHEDVSPLNLWEVRHAGKKKHSMTAIEADYLFPAIANEMILLNRKGIGFGQFAVLIADRHQGTRLGDYLRRLDIPVKNQKGSDISHSSAVEEMRDLLNGILHGQSKSKLKIALAGRLIRMNHLELIKLDEAGIYPFVAQFSQLKQIFIENGFAKFYTTFMNSVWHADGKNVLERLLNESKGLDFHREWQDLADLLMDEQQARSFSPQGMITFLDELKELSCNEDERIKAYVDPDEEGVSVLTMHMSKGLEFDIVFALGLIKRTKQSEDILIPMEEAEKFKLCPVESTEDPRYRKFCEESDAEKMRQLYVALTRAREKLYVPFVVELEPKEVAIGCASPMDLLLAKLAGPSLDYDALYQGVSTVNGSILQALADQFPEKMRLTLLTKQNDQLSANQKPVPALLFPPREVKIPGMRQTIQSFTSLSQGGPSYGKGQPFTLEVSPVPHDFFNEEKNEHTLPSGNETGVMLHKIFELLPFESVRNLTSTEQLRPLISPFLKGSSFALWEDVVAKIAFNALTVPLHEGEFCLADLDPKKIYRETEFFYPCDPEHAMFPKENLAKPGYLKGVVDVFFEHQGKYYLLDWKSNWLGPDHSSYHQEKIAETMRVNQYDLQAAIYCEAFRRYLKIFDERPFEEVFGGVYYLFVRGIGPHTGIFHLLQKDAK